MTQRTSSTPRTTAQQEWLRESADQLPPRRNDGDGTERLAPIDASALLTDLQRAALRWIAFFD